MKKQQKTIFQEKFADFIDKNGMDEFKGMTFDEILLATANRC